MRLKQEDQMVDTRSLPPMALTYINIIVVMNMKSIKLVAVILFAALLCDVADATAQKTQQEMRGQR